LTTEPAVIGSRAMAACGGFLCDALRPTSDDPMFDVFVFVVSSEQSKCCPRQASRIPRTTFAFVPSSRAHRGCAR
jgi:hypothetical protein